MEPVGHMPTGGTKKKSSNNKNSQGNSTPKPPTRRITRAMPMDEGDSPVESRSPSVEMDDQSVSPVRDNRSPSLVLEGRTPSPMVDRRSPTPENDSDEDYVVQEERKLDLGVVLWLNDLKTDSQPVSWRCGYPSAAVSRKANSNGTSSGGVPGTILPNTVIVVSPLYESPSRGIDTEGRATVSLAQWPERKRTVGVKGFNPAVQKDSTSCTVSLLPY